jgi:hypothetical protein
MPSRAPARPASATAIVDSIHRSNDVRRALGAVSAAGCSAKSSITSSVVPAKLGVRSRAALFRFIAAAQASLYQQLRGHLAAPSSTTASRPAVATTKRRLKLAAMRRAAACYGFRPDSTFNGSPTGAGSPCTPDTESAY